MSNQDQAREREDDDAIREGITGEIMPQEVSPVIAAEINQQVATARRYPRRAVSVISDEIKQLAAMNLDVAAECMYSLKRGQGEDGKVITGASIRFAEIVRSAYGNMRVAARFVRLDLDDPLRAAVVVEAVGFDVQNNNAEIIPVRRSIMTSGKGGRAPRIFNADMTNTTVMAAVSIARRNAILAVVPKAIWQTGYQEAVAVIQGKGSTFVERWNKASEIFAKYGATIAQVLAALDLKDGRDVTVEHLPAIYGFLTALKEGETVASVLGRAGPEPGANHQVIVDPLKDEPRGEREGTLDKPGQAGTLREAVDERVMKENATRERVQNGTSEQARGAPETVKERPAEAGAERAGPGDGNKPAPAQNEGGRATAGEARQDPQTSAQAGNGAPAGGMTNDAFVEAGCKFMASASSRTALDEYWKGAKKERESRKLTAEQLDRLTRARDARREAFQ